MYQKIFLRSLFLIFLIYLRVTSGYVINDITPLGRNNLYSQNSVDCVYVYQIEFLFDTPNEISLADFSVPPPNNYNVTKGGAGYQMAINYWITLKIPVGNIPGNFSIVYQLTTTLVTYPYDNCFVTPYPLVNTNSQTKFIPTTYNQRYDNYMLLNFPSLLKKTTLFPTVNSPFICSFEQFGYETLLVYCNLYVLNELTTDIPENIVITIPDPSSSSRSSVFTFSTFTLDNYPLEISHPVYQDASNLKYQRYLVLTEIPKLNNARYYSNDAIVKDQYIVKQNNTHKTIATVIKYLATDTYSNWCPSYSNFKYIGGSFNGGIVTLAAKPTLGTSSYLPSYVYDLQALSENYIVSNYFGNFQSSTNWRQNIDIVDNPYPYGILKFGPNQDITFSNQIIAPPISGVAFSTYVDSKLLGTVSTTSNFPTAAISTYPVLKLFKIISLGYGRCILRFDYICSNYGIHNATAYGLTLGQEDVSVSNGLNNGTLEKLFQLDKDSLSLRQIGAIMDGIYFTSDLAFESTLPHLYGQGMPLPNLGYMNKSYSESINTISNIKFMIISPVDLTYSPVENALMVSFNNVKSNGTISLLIKTDYFNVDYCDGYWSQETGYFIFPFTMRPRPAPGTLYYEIYYQGLVYKSTMLPEKYQLYFTSKVTDRFPPIVSSFSTDVSLDDSNFVKLNWHFLITDELNGLKQGSIGIRSTLNNVASIEFPIQTISTDNKYQYNLTITLTLPKKECVNQDYYIYHVYLEDFGGAKSEYFKDNLEYTSYISPFYLQNQTTLPSNLIISSSDCSGSKTSTIPASPVIVSIVPSTVDIGSKNRDVTITFYITDPDGISQLPIHTPICFAHRVNFQRINVTAELILNGNTNCTFTCKFTFPFGYSYPSDKVFFSIFGYSDSSYNMGGSNFGGTVYVNTIFTQVDPVVDQILPIYVHQNSLSIVGHNFITPGQQQSSIVIKIDYPDSTENYTVSSMYNNLIVVNNFTPQSQFTLTIIFPDIKKESLPISVVPINPPSLIPTNPPTGTCQSDCGGPSNGQCTINGCVCIGIWTGPTCTSKINTNIDPPKISPTEPSANSSVIEPDGETIVFKSLVSIIGLKEYSFDGKELADYKFNNIAWKYTNAPGTTSSQIKNVYNTQIKNQNFNNSTNITITIEYFTKSETIYFAEEQLTMNPNTLKYTVEITSYQFTSKLNYLQLIMNASVTTNTDSSCSYFEKGDIINSDSEYFKLQIDNNSLYSRFIKRAMIDGLPQYITNELVYNSSTFSESAQTIGINIPSFTVKALIDPDFSLLIDSSPASDQTTSICGKQNEDSSKLTKSQLAGIIIGSVGFVLVAVVSITYIFYKKRQDLKIFKKLTQIQNRYK